MVSADAILLHLTDLHFGWDAGDANARALRKVALDKLIDTLRSLDPEWRPTVVCVTGDIGWRGSTQDYKCAHTWLNDMMQAVGIDADALILCPGNHDLERSVAERIPPPHTSKEADRAIKFPLADANTSPFAKFEQFCKDSLHVPANKIGSSNSYLFGERRIGKVRYIVLNSAWACRGRRGQRPPVAWPTPNQVPESEGQISNGRIAKTDEPITIALVHHPREWYHNAEVQAEPDRANTFDYLMTRCDVLLTGHTHGEVRPADRFADGAYHLSGGATYAGANYQNNFRLIRIAGHDLEYRSFEYDPRALDQPWQPHSETRELRLRDRAGPRTPHPPLQMTTDLSGYAEAAREDARRFQQKKSRAISLVDPPPNQIQLYVSLCVRDQQHRRGAEATSQSVKSNASK